MFLIGEICVKLNSFMEVLFLVLTCVPLAALLFGIRMLAKKKDRFSALLSPVLVLIVVSLLSQIAVYFSENLFLEGVFRALYYAELAWVFAAFFNLCAHESGGLVRKTFRYVVLPLSALCALAVPAAYFLRSYADLGAFFLGYSAFIFVLFACCSGILLFKSVKSPAAFRPKYLSLLLFDVLVFVSEAVYVCGLVFGVGFPLAFSGIVCAVCFLVIYRSVYEGIPQRLIQRTLEMIAGNLKDGIVLLDNDGKCIYANAFVEDILRSGRDSVLELEIFEEFFRRRRESGAEENASFSDEFDYAFDVTRRYVLRISDFRMKDRDSVIARYYLIEDVTDSKNQKILRTRDKLTGLFNQEYFFEKVEHRLKYDRFTPYYLVVSDIVNFKLINRLYGRDFGDDILIHFADAIQKYSAPDDIFARLYNDHFIVLVPKRRFDEKKYAEIFSWNHSSLTDFAYSLVCHFGVYEIDDLSLTASSMCDRAFFALRSIKNNSETAFVYYDDEMRRENVQMQMLMSELPRVLRSGALRLCLQPQVTREGKALGAEAFVCWHHHERGVISPDEFSGLVEKINIVSDVDRCLWERACETLAQWKARGHGDLRVSVNVSAKDFIVMDLHETLTSLVEKYGLSPANLSLKISETAVIMDFENRLSLLDKLCSSGFMIEIYDFGKGRSSLDLLKNVHVDVLRIDAAFFQKARDADKGRLILEKIIMFAKNLGMRVVCSGVEGGSQADFLAAAGCDLFQGGFFSDPVSADDFEKKYLGQNAGFEK